MRLLTRLFVLTLCLFCFMEMATAAQAQVVLSPPLCLNSATTRTTVSSTCRGSERCTILKPFKVSTVTVNGIAAQAATDEINQTCSAAGGTTMEYQSADGLRILCSLRANDCAPLPETCVQSSTCSSSGTTPGVDDGTFDDLNKAIFGDAGPPAELTTPRGIISRAMPYLFVFGGLTLFVMLLWGGFEMLTGAANPKSQEAGRQRMTAAVVGFILLFVSYWFAQLLELVFGISIL